MSKLLLYVPTRGRVGNQRTLKALPSKWRERAIIVCPKDEIRSHLKSFPEATAIAQPDPDMTIAAKRAWIFKTARSEKIMMLDDDLRFAVRVKTLKEFKGYAPEGSRGRTRDSRWAKACKKDPDIHKMITVKNDDSRLIAMFDAIEKMLSDYRHGGIGT